MKINKTHIKYIAWLSPEKLHQDTLEAISDIKFVKDELRFLNELLEENTLLILHQNLLGKARIIASQLSTLQETIPSLLKKLIAHANKLELLLDEVDEPDEEKIYKDEHYSIIAEVVSLYAQFKKVKRKLFQLSKETLKAKKKGHLLPHN